VDHPARIRCSAQWTRALLGGKPLLVLEEPFRAMDAREASRCAAVLAERLAAGAAALVLESSDHLAGCEICPLPLQ
jgi:ABC-type Mn2+/Zn2+ transport system ATPase subunit